MPISFDQPIDRVEGISKEEFQEKYAKPKKPVIIRNFFGEDAPLYTKWTFDYMKEILGDFDIGIFDDGNTTVKDREDRSYKAPDMYMKFGDYIDLIQREPTQKRIFLFNVLKHRPELRNDYEYPPIDDKYIKKLPMLFFGGEGSVTRIHHDMDMSNVFLTELHGKKRVVLFDPKYSRLLHRFPFNVHTSADITNPDYEKYPGLDKVRGYEAIIESRDTLFMPSGYWHHIEYMTGSMGIAVRSLSPRYMDTLRGVYNIAVLTHLDELFRYTMKDKWFRTKERIAKRRAQSDLNRM